MLALVLWEADAEAGLGVRAGQGPRRAELQERWAEVSRLQSRDSAAAWPPFVPLSPRDGCKSGSPCAQSLGSGACTDVAVARWRAGVNQGSTDWDGSILLGCLHSLW